MVVGVGIGIGIGKTAQFPEYSCCRILGGLSKLFALPDPDFTQSDALDAVAGAERVQRVKLLR